MLDYEELFRAYRDCRKHKSNTLSSIEFEFNQEFNLMKLYSELVNGTYEIDYSICFVVIYPKIREVWAANFRDRIVHHLIYNRIKDIFYNRFTVDTYSCIPKRGTKAAMEKIRKYSREITQGYTKDAYYLKADIKNFFVTIDKDILYKLLARYVKDDWILKLCKQVIYNDPRNSAVLHSPKYLFEKLPKYKSLWYSPNVKGLPIGNLTSQFFSNVYLNELDQYVKHKLKCKYYCRYVDDFIILDEDPHKLHRIHGELLKFLKERLKLDLHVKKREINKISRGLDFVGYSIKPYRTFLRERIIKRIYKTIYIHSRADYDIEEQNKFIRTINSYLGMMKWTNNYNMRRDICLRSINLFIGCDENFSKLFLREKCKKT